LFPARVLLGRFQGLEIATVKKQNKTNKSTNLSSGSRGLMIAGLLGSLVVASILVIAYGPAPLRKVQPTLMVVDPATLYNTATQVRNWNTLYIHHSKTQTDDWDSQNAGDHFVIGNGNSVGDGEIVMTSRWQSQQTGAVNGLEISRGWISICLEGDFDASPPTQSQIMRVGQLLSELQKHFGIASNQIIVRNTERSADGIGNLFPKQELAQYIRP